MRSHIVCCLGIVAVGSLALAPVAWAQSDIVPRTPSGRPDLSGTYDISTLTPMERPIALGEKMFLSDEEAAEIAAREHALMTRRNAATDPNRDAPPAGGDGSTGAAGNVGGYNSFWIDRGTGAFQVDGRWRTSILIDPSNGRYPALTEQRATAVRAARRGVIQRAHNSERITMVRRTGWIWGSRHPGPTTTWSSGRMASGAWSGSVRRAVLRCCRSCITTISGSCKPKMWS